MNRLRSVLILAVVVAGAVALLPACSVVNPPALTVGTFSLSRDEFFDEMTTLTQKGALDANQQQQGAPKLGTSVPTNYKTSDTAAVLNVHAQYQITKQALEAKGVKVTDDDTARFLQQTAQEAASQGQQVTVDQLEQQLATLDSLRRMNVDNQIALSALGRALVSDAEVQEKAKADYAANKDKLSQTCLSYIHAAAGAPPSRQNPTPAAPSDADYAAAQAKMQAAKAKIDGGAAFADVAKSDSDDSQTATKGGQVGCLPASQLQQLPPAIGQLVAQLPVGAVSEPTRQDRDGYYLFSVTRRGTPEFNEVQANLEGNARTTLEQDRAKKTVDEIAKTITVTVDPLFGRWDPAQAEVTPPAGAEQPATSLPGLSTGGGQGLPVGPSATP